MITPPVHRSASRLRLVTDQFFTLRPNSGVKRSLEETSEDEERLKEVVKLRQMKKALKKQKVQAKRGWWFSRVRFTSNGLNERRKAS